MAPPAFAGQAVDRPVDDKGRTEPVSPQAGDKGGDLPRAVRNGADQTRPALLAAAGSGHVGGGPGLVDEDAPGRIKPALALPPSLPGGGDVRAGLLGGVRGFFLKLMPCRSKNRQIVEIAAGNPRSPSRARISSSVRSGVSATSCKSHSRCRSIAAERRSPPCGTTPAPA